VFFFFFGFTLRQHLNCLEENQWDLKYPRYFLGGARPSKTTNYTNLWQ